MTHDANKPVEGLASALDEAGFSTEFSTIGGIGALIARRSEFRMEWVAARLHTFVVAFAPGDLSAARADQLSSDAQEYAIKHKGGLPRGLQNGTATIAVFLWRGR